MFILEKQLSLESNIVGACDSAPQFCHIVPLSACLFVNLPFFASMSFSLRIVVSLSPDHQAREKKLWLKSQTENFKSPIDGTADIILSQFVGVVGAESHPLAKDCCPKLHYPREVPALPKLTYCRRAENVATIFSRRLTSMSLPSAKHLHIFHLFCVLSWLSPQWSGPRQEC